MFGPGTRARTAPSHYPRLPFHAIRLVQLVSSIVVGTTMIYFMHHLATSNVGIPWVFIFLMASSLFSIVALSFTMVMHCAIGLNPRLNLLINGGLTMLWGGTWATLTWFMHGTLREVCDVENWHDETGVMVCRVYKSLFTFSLFGFLSTLAAFCLDMYVRRQQTRSGIYRLHDMDGQQPHKGNDSRFPAGLQFAPSSNAQGYSQPEGQYRYDTAYQSGYAH